MSETEYELKQELKHMARNLATAKEELKEVEQQKMKLAFENKELHTKIVQLNIALHAAQNLASKHKARLAELEAVGMTSASRSSRPLSPAAKRIGTARSPSSICVQSARQLLHN